MDHPIRPIGSALFALLGTLLIGLSDNLIQYVRQDAGLWQFLAIRSVMQGIILISVAFLLGLQILPRNWRGVLGRTGIMTISMVIYFASLSFLPIQVVIAGLFTAPIFVLLHTALIRRKKVGPWRWGAASIGFVGLLLVIQPNPYALDWSGFIPVIAGMLYAVVSIATREWCEGEGTLVLTLFTFLGLGIMGGIGLIWFGLNPIESPQYISRGYEPIDTRFLWMMVVIALTAAAGVFSMTRGYQIGDAPFVAILEYSLIISATIWAWLLFGDLPNLMAIVGIALIIVSGVVIVLRSR